MTEKEQQTEEKSQEQLRAEKVADIAQKLVEKDKPTGATCLTLIIAEQLYHAALHALNERMQELGQDNDVLVHLQQSMRHAASKEFMLDDLPNRVQSAVLPWLAARVTSLNAELLREKQLQNEEKKEERSQRPIPLGFKCEGVSALKRSRPMVLVGECSLVQSMLSLIRRTAYGSHLDMLSDRLRVMTFSNEDRQFINRKGEAKFSITAGGPAWKKKGKSSKTIMEIIRRHVRLLDAQQLDLLVVEDLGQLAPNGSPGDTRSAGAVLPILKRCHSEFGCGILAGVPFVGEDLAHRPENFEDNSLRNLSNNSSLHWLSTGNMLSEASPHFEALYELLLDGSPTDQCVTEESRVIVPSHEEFTSKQSRDQSEEK